MARLARSRPHRPVFPQSFVAPSSVSPVRSLPIIRSRAIEAAKQRRVGMVQRQVRPSPFVSGSGSSDPDDLVPSRLYRARRIGYRPSDGKPLFKIAGPCPNAEGEWDAGTILPWKRIGVRPGGSPLGKIMAVNCASDGGLTIGRVYAGRRIGSRGGAPLFKVDCVPECEEGGFCCQCERFTCPDGSFPATIDCTLTIPCLGTTTQTLTLVESQDRCVVNAGVTAGYTFAMITYGEEEFVSQLLCPLGTPLGTISTVEEHLYIFLKCVDTNHGVLGGSTDGTIYCAGQGFWYADINWYKRVGGSVRHARACGLFGSIFSNTVVCDPFYLHSQGEILCGDVLGYPGCTASGLYLSGLTFYSSTLACVGGTGQVEFME